MKSHLNLLNVNVFKLLFHLLDPGLHGVDGGLGVLQALGCKVGLFHVEALIPQVLCL